MYVQIHYFSLGIPICLGDKPLNVTAFTNFLKPSLGKKFDLFLTSIYVYIMI